MRSPFSNQRRLAFILGYCVMGGQTGEPEGGSGVAGCLLVVMAVFLWLPSAVPTPVCVGCMSSLYECGGRCSCPRTEGPREVLTALVPTCPPPLTPTLWVSYVDLCRCSPSR